MSARNAVVALTDRRWFDFLRSRAAEGVLDEVNFWRPRAQTSFRRLAAGEPFFFRLKSPVNKIAGYGFFALDTKVTVRLAWEAFRERNGDATFEGFVSRIAGYRGQSFGETLDDSKELTCLVLRDARFLSEDLWLPWSGERGWGRHLVTYKGYDLDVGPGLALRDLLVASAPEDLEPEYVPSADDARIRKELEVTLREGQGSFRLRILDAYGRRCAVTGERSIPVLDAAHIQPYRGPASNHVQNGLSLRADLHRLFDAGYVTVTPDHRFLVSSRLKDDYRNGKVYYEMHGARLAVLPHDPRTQPSPLALDWHATHVFR